MIYEFLLHIHAWHYLVDVQVDFDDFNLVAVSVAIDDDVYLKLDMAAMSEHRKAEFFHAALTEMKRIQEDAKHDQAIDDVN